MQKKTMIIAVEGIDGSGKTLQMNRLVSRLKQRGFSVMELSFPRYSNFFGEQIGHFLRGEWVRADKVDSRSMCLWFAMDRWKAFQEIDYSEYDILLINRYTLSNAVYQAIRDIDLGLGDNWEWVKELECGQLDLPEPDLYLLLDLDPELAQKNVDNKGQREYIDGRDVYEEQQDLLARARARYLDIASREQNVAIVSCMEGGKQASPDLVALRVWDALKAALSLI